MAEVDSETLRRDIKEILSDADLTTLSGKKVRKTLEEKHGEDFNERKKEIDNILMEELEELQKNGKEDDSDSDEEPPSKKAKPQSSSKSADLSSDSEADDEEVAKKLQDEINTEGKRTRGRGASSSTSKKTTQKNPDKPKKPPKNCFLSPTLAAVVGGNRMPRSEVVKRMWQIIKERNLQDPKQKNFMICDDEMFGLFGRKRIKTFGMMKYLTHHIFKSESDFESSTC